MARVRGPGAETAKGIPWDVCWTDADGRERSKRFYDETRAIKEAGKIEDQIRRGANTDPRAGRQTFKAVAEDWLATKVKARPATRAKYRQQLVDYALPAFGSRRIASITAADAGRFVESLYTTERDTPRQAAGVTRIMYPVRAVFAYALDEGYITRDPTRKVPNPSAETLGQEDFEGTALTPAQVAALAAACGAKHHLGELIVWFVALTGVRAGELERLDLGHVNALHRYVTVPGTKSRRSKGRRVDYAADLSPKLHAFVEQHPSAGDASAPLFYGKASRTRIDPGKRMDQNRFYKRIFKPAAVKLGLPDVRFHDLRHTAGSWWIESGYSLEEVADRLGHADINFTRRTYIHQLHTRASQSADKHAVWLESQLTAPTNVVQLHRAAG